MKVDAYRVQPISRTDKTRRERQAEVVVLEQIRAEIAARHKQYIEVPDESAEELAQRKELNRQFDSIGHVGAALAAILGIAVLAACPAFIAS